MATLLRLGGHEVRTAYDGQTALALARIEPPTWSSATSACRGWAVMSSLATSAKIWAFETRF